MNDQQNAQYETPVNVVQEWADTYQFVAKDKYWERPGWCTARRSWFQPNCRLLILHLHVGKHTKFLSSLCFQAKPLCVFCNWFYEAPLFSITAAPQQTFPRGENPQTSSWHHGDNNTYLMYADDTNYIKLKKNNMEKEPK